MVAEISHIDMIFTTGVKKASIKKISRENVLRPACIHHVNVTLGKHFRDIPETRPGGAYGYVKRSKQYTQRKLRTYGHSLPNVFTGRLKRGVRALTLQTIRATATRGTIRIKAPLRSTKTGRNFSLTAQQKRELSAVSWQEKLEINKRGNVNFAKEASKPEHRLKRKKRI